MNLTNKHGFHKAIVRAIEADTYSKGESDYSCTGLLKPARVSALEAIHKDELSEDVDDKMFILYGQIAHYILERSGLALDKNIIEKRFFMKVPVDGKTYTISAQIDTLSLDVDGILTDFKFTSVFGFKDKSKPKDDYISQMNIQLELLRQNGLDAKRLQICGLMRDWRPGEYKKGNYPKKVATLDIPIWPREKTLAFITERIKAHEKAKTELPDCTSDENWGWRRCESYCPAHIYCDQYFNYISGKKLLNLNKEQE